MQLTWSPLLVTAATGLFICCFLSNAQGQLTFSPDWGKRSGVSMVGSGSGPSSGGFFDSPSQAGLNCKTTNEMLMEIFRFVQGEAQLFLDCKHRE